MEGAVANWVRELRGCVSAADLDDLRRAISGGESLFREVNGFAGMAPRYRVIHGTAVHRALPQVVSFGERLVRPLVEAFAGRPLAPLRENAFDIRIQLFRRGGDYFRWHFDGHTYNALVTLTNTIGAETEVVPFAVSRAVRRVYMPFALFPTVFSVLPRMRFAMDAGDVLVLRGGQLLHRGVCHGAEGERLLIVFGYNDADAPPRRVSPFRRRVSRLINYGELGPG